MDQLKAGKFDTIVGSVMKQVEEMGETDNTIIIVTTDNGTQSFSWPDGGNSPFKGDKGSANEGGFRSPAVIRWPGKVAPNRVINGLISGMDWLPTFVSAAGNKDIKKELLDGKSMGGKDYKVHLDGYDQTEMLVNEGASTRNELWYFTQGNLAAVRLGDDKIVLLDQPNGWLAGTVKLNWPKLYNLRLDPFERLGFGPGESKFSFSAFYAHEFWCFVNLQEEVGLLAKTAIEYPAMQEGASFNLDAVKEQIKGLQHKAGK
jgi:arylsulfatase A-like enzyme